ncbi:ABC transporter substrate-binding protein [Desulfobacter postgatei]|uniref:ABC transporter substrate-binding protein n=1 Tax=Desulfobacter postgatei TaxID=2293 RepID=UPI00259B1A7E|nr:ABC transporter substrate-binding protein [uncultured Desulfobacter sp.]
MAIERLGPSSEAPCLAMHLDDVTYTYEILREGFFTVFHKKTSSSGGDGFYCHAVLLPTFKESGNKRLQALVAIVLEGLHPAQMVNPIDNNGPGALYVMPAFFCGILQL